MTGTRLKANMNDRKPTLTVATAIAVVVAAGLLTRGTAAPTSDGRIVYSNNTTTPQSKPYAVSTNSFGANANPATTAGQSWFVNRTSPTRNESIAAYAAGTTLYVTRWDGSAWQPAFNVVGPAVTGRWFDVAYETISGDAIVVYSNNSTTTELAYRTWNGSAWSAATTRVSNRTAQMVNWVKLDSHPTTNAVALAFSDTNQDLSALIWDGAAWGNEPGAVLDTNLSRANTSGDYDTFDLAYESSGELLLVWGNENFTYTDARYVRFTTAWSATNEVANLGVVPAHLSLAADPGSDNILLAYSRDGGSTDLRGSRWNGTAWSAPTTLNGLAGAQAPVASAASRRPFSTGWLTSGTTEVGIVPYSTSASATTINYFYYDMATSAWISGTAWTPGGAPIAAEQWLRVVRDPNGGDTAMVTFSDTNSDLWAKRVVLSPGPLFTWTNADGGTALTPTLANLGVENFSFAYARLLTTLTVATGSDPGNATVCPGSAASPLDAFVLQTNFGTDTVTAVTVSLATGTWNGISSVQITSDNGATVYGSATPAGDSVTVNLTTNIAATTSATQYKVRIVPNTHAAMPPRPGSSYDVTGTVTSLASTYTKTYGDTASATLTIDNASPAEAAWGTNAVGSGSITLNWTNPLLDFSEVVIGRNTATPIADAPTEGGTYSVPGSIGTSTIVYVGNLQTFADTGVTNGSTYFYKIFARDPCGNYSSGLESGALTPQAPNPKVTTLPGSGVVDSCTQIRLSAPFNKDTPTANNTVTFDRATTIGGPWTTVCSNVATGNPRTCTASALTAGTTYYFRLTFTDPDGVEGQNPQIVGPLTTPSSCVSAATTAGTASARLSSCRQITVTAPFTGDGDADGSTKVEINTANTWPGTTACNAVTGVSPRQCLVTGLSPSTQYYVRVTTADPDGVAGTNPQVIGPLTTTACAADQVAPMVLFLAPARNAVIGGTDKVKVQVWDSGGLAATDPVQWSVDGGALSTAVTTNTNYVCGTGCSIREFDFNTSALANGAHYLTVQATDAAGNVAQTTQGVVVNNSGGNARGGGTNLRRTHGSQLCIDCHALATHSSQMTSTKYGNWAVDCLTCHTPHKTRNIGLIRESVETPNSGRQTVVFQQNDKIGGSNLQLSHLGDYAGGGNTPYNDGVCESCHTKTNHYRNDSSGGDHTHNQTTRCVGCHIHQQGFAAAESIGGFTCQRCHPAIWNGMTGGVAKTSKHTLGNVIGVNDAFTDNSTTFGNPLRATTPAQRLCLSCHQDHAHNAMGSTLHEANVHQDASTAATRAVTRGAGGVITGGTPEKTDFNNAAANGGMCISCHRNPTDTGRPVIDKTAYAASAHNYVTFSTYGTWTYDLHDGSKFDRNCTKCHSDRADGQPAAAATPFGAVHFSDYPLILSGSKNPNGTPATFVCYNCHGNGTTGTNRSGKAIATTIAKTANHPSNADNSHDSVTELANTAFGNSLGGAARHSNCMDCHNTHTAKPGPHVTPGNAVAPSLEGAWGAQLSTNPARWAVPATGNFTKKTIVAGDLEATLCFKCHSSYYWGGTATPPAASPIAPSSGAPGWRETDQAQEFNPNNASTGATAGSFHPVLASAGANLGATSNIKAPWTRTSTMTCSDCHASDQTTDPSGPHGSAAGFLLKGPNTTWNATIATGSGGMPAGTFCINCHNQNFTSSRFPAHTTRSDHYIQCWNCHAAIPHGTARPGLLVAVDQSTYGDKTTDKAPWRQMPDATNRGLYIKSYPANNTTNWSQSNCGCGTGGGH